VLVTGCEIVSTFGKPELVYIGKCDLIEQVSSLDKILFPYSYLLFHFCPTEGQSNRWLCHKSVYLSVFFVSNSPGREETPPSWWRAGRRPECRE
jgi:hypothetical protein